MRRLVATTSIATLFASVVPLAATASASANPTPPAAQSPAQPTRTSFQVTYDGQSFPYSLPPSSMATFTINPGSNSVSVTETDTANGKLVKGMKLEPQPSVPLGTSSGSSPNINVDSSKPMQMQSISGFGGAMTESAAELINNSPSEKVVMNKLFSASGANFNIVRVPMGASDFVTGPIYQNDTSFSYDDNLGRHNKSKPDPTLANFSIGTQSTKGYEAQPCVPATTPDEYGTGDYADTIPALRCAQSMSSNLNLLAAPWSAPGWMKMADNTVASSCTGSNDFLNPSDYSIYADYFLKFLQAYQLADLPVSEISMQNEPENCKMNYPTMEMNASSQATSNEATFAQDLYGTVHAPALGLSTIPTIMAYDHDYLDPWMHRPIRLQTTQRLSLGSPVAPRRRSDR